MLSVILTMPIYTYRLTENLKAVSHKKKKNNCGQKE